MKKSQSLKERKFNVVIPKSTNNIPKIQNKEKEKVENKYPNKIVIKTLGEIPYLLLPIKRMPHTKKHKNRKINPISLEKLRYVILNLKMSKNEQSKYQRQKSHNKNINIFSPYKNFNKNKHKTYNNKSQSNKTLNIEEDTKDIINYNSENNSKANNMSISINNINPININRSNSSETEINTNIFGNENLKFRNKEKKWYNNIDFLTEKYNELILTTENLEKNLINKYLEGTDNIISEMEEPQFLREDIEINTINVNASLRKHLSIRETTLDSSYHNSHNHTGKLKGKQKGIILRINNYRKMFKKYRTNFILKSIKPNNNNFKEKMFRSKKRNDRRKKKLPMFNKSAYKINNQNIGNDEEEKNLNKNLVIHHRNISCDKENINYYTSLNEKNENKNLLPKKDKNKLYKGKRNTSLDIIKETNDNINIELKDKINIRKQSVKLINENNSKSKRKNNYKEKNPKENFIHSSGKYLNNYKPKIVFNKAKTIFNKNYIFLNDENIIKDMKQSSIDEYIISKDLGIGSYAEVKLGIHKITKKRYAIKIYDKNIVNDEEKKNTIKNEIFILKQLNNENIMKLYDVIETNRHLYLILEYINGISLLDYIQREENRRISENVCKKLFYQIVKAILHCQNKNICHRDIKLENILVINENIIKLIDFGFAIKCNRNEYQEFFCGTLYYMPPEIVNKQKYIPFYSDIWSLGILLYTMLFGNFPFKSNKEEKLFELINEAKLVFPENIDVSDEVKLLLSKIIVFKPSKRISLEEILSDPWFKTNI